jgi:transposase
MARRERIEPTEGWTELEPRLQWPEQVNYELIRPPLLSDVSVAERSRQTGASESRLRRGITGFKSHGMRSLFEPEQVEKHSQLDPEVRGLILNLKAEYPPMRPNEIGTICYVRFGRRPHDRTIKRVLEGHPIAIRMFRRLEHYHDIPDVIERRKAIVTLHSEGWNVKSIAGYLKTSRPTVYRTLNKWFAEGVLGLEDKPRGGICKTDLRAMNEVRKLQENPELGAFRVSAALEQMGIYLSPRTCGRILAVNRQLYGLEKPKRGPKEKKDMPFRSNKRHEIWTVDIRYIGHKVAEENKLYCISVLENHSRALLASAVSRSKDLTAYLSVLHSAVSHYGAPEVLVTDSEGLFRANQARAIYNSLGITKKEIEKGQAWQSYIESAFSVQQRLADYYFSRAQSFEEIVAVHDRFVADYNTQKHFAHDDRTDGRRSPAEVLGWLVSVRHVPEELERAFFSVRFVRKLNASGYARIRHWRIYCEEGLAHSRVALWLGADALTAEFAGETLARYEVAYSPSAGRLREVKSVRLFATRYGPLQLRLFELSDALGETGWLKALKMDEYAPRLSRAQGSAQRTLFPYAQAL